jgi:hypothetical protein
MKNITQALSRLQEERRKTLQQADRLNEAITALERLTRNSRVTTFPGRVARAKRVLSAAGRRRISLAQKARWAKVRSMKRAA